MIPVMQTRGGAAYRRWTTQGVREVVVGGNCFQAAIASLFELPLDAVPDLVNEWWNSDWFEAFQGWALHRLSVQPVYVSIRKDGDGWAPDALPWAPAGWALASGRSHRGHQHVVVVNNGKLAHDPFPPLPGEEADRGLDAVDGYYVFLPVAGAAMEPTACGAQHVDAPEPERGWTNPIHRSHLCSACGSVWRPADIPTVGVKEITTRGSGDTWPRNPSRPAPPPTGTLDQRKILQGRL